MTFKEFSLKTSLVPLIDNLFKKVSYFLKNNSKLLAVSNGSKMLVLTAFFAVMPVNTISISNAKPYNTNLKLDTNAPLSIISDQAKTALVIGDSEFDIANKQKALIATQTATKKTQTTVVTVSYSDPTDLSTIYKIAGKQFGIPWQLIEAVHQVESGKSGSTCKRSYAGAIGPMQFMPGTFRAYEVDGNNDGMADPCNVVDAVYTAANYLAKSGADEGNIDAALLNYNHSMSYVNTVKTIAYEIGM